MLKNIIGASIGSHLTKKPAAGGALGATLATAVPFVLSRMSLPTMAALGVGGYLVKRHLDKKKSEEQAEEMQKVSGVKKAKPTEAPEPELDFEDDPEGEPAGDLLEEDPNGQTTISGDSADLYRRTLDETRALDVDDALQTWEEYLQREGVEYIPRRTRPDGAYQIYVFDPDGHCLELCTEAGVADG